MKEFVLLLLFFHVASPVLHSLIYFYATSSGVPNLPEFVGVGLVDDVQMIYYDSNTQRAEPKQDWMSKVTADDPQYLERDTGYWRSAQQINKGSLETAKQHLNQTGGVHISQWMTGCEWDDETDEMNGFAQSGYDGEDFIVLDLKTLTWVAPVPQALLSKYKLDANTALSARWKHYLTTECIDWLKKHLDYGRSILKRTVLPSVSLLQKSPSSPVSCHATGFYPNRAQMFWRKDGEEVHVGVDPGEILPNHDGSFQKSVDLNVSFVRREDWGTYECVFQLSGVSEPKVTVLDPKLIRTNWRKTEDDDGGFPVGLVIGVAVVLLLLTVIIGFLIWRRNNMNNDEWISEHSLSFVSFLQFLIYLLFIFLSFNLYMEEEIRRVAELQSLTSSDSLLQLKAL